VMKKILMMTDDDIKDIQKQQGEEGPPEGQEEE
jgi:hypothetical protein